MWFNIYDYQTDAVMSVIDCFDGQPSSGRKDSQILSTTDVFKNAEVQLTSEEVLQNVRDVQRRQNIPMSVSLKDFKTYNTKGGTKCYPYASATDYHLDVEMETGTGKTYCYTKTIYEFNKRHGWMINVNT